jgi:hypothetical protein
MLKTNQDTNRTSSPSFFFFTHSLKGPIMNTKSILAIAAFAAVASTGVHADEADASQYAV